MRDLLLVIDMQNVYTPAMPWACGSIERCEENILKLLGSGIDSAFTMFLPPQNPQGRWKEYSAVNREINENAWMNELIPAFKPYVNENNIFYKSTYSSLHAEGLLARIKEYDRVVVSGVVAECCVLSTVFSLIDEGIPFVYLSDAVSGLNEKSENEAEAVISYLVPVHGEIMSTEAYICSSLRRLC